MRWKTRIDRESLITAINSAIVSAIFLFFGYVVTAGSMGALPQTCRLVGLLSAVVSVAALLHAVAKGRRD